MRHRVLASSFAWIALAVLTCKVPAAAPSVEEIAKTRLTELTRGDSPGIAVLIARDGKVVFQAGFGFADIESKTPVTPETKFRIGSITKQFTAAAIVRLAEQGKLALADPLAKFFPDIPQGDKVTVQQLLTHTSGIHSYTEKPDFMLRVTKPIEPRYLIEWFRDDPPDFAPGKGFHYNNSAYFLLGEIVAQVGGKPYGDFLRDTFFEPLGLKDTGVFVNSQPPPSMAIGYSFADGKTHPAIDWDMSWAGGAGALYSTVGDLYRWNDALFAGKVIGEASLKAATTPVELPADVDGMNYGFGLMMYEISRLPAIGHGGGLNGWSTNLVYLPAQKCTVVVLTNAMPAPPGYGPGGIAAGMAQTLLSEEIRSLPPLVEDASVDPKSFAAYEGRYEYPGAINTVTVEEDGLYSQLTGQPKTRIFPQGKDEFFWKVADARAKFVRNENGDVIALRHTQNGNTFRAGRLPEDPVKLTVEQVEAIVGKYQYAPFVVLTVTRDGTQLFAQLTGQPKMPIFPKAENEFEWRVVKASVRFEPGDDGTISKAIHSQNGGTIEAPRIK
ncbi:MAG: serine hydrolase [Planctomycetes bacterium]|nr:serine hydrolase [Planctomycetota bacterium]